MDDAGNCISFIGFTFVSNVICSPDVFLQIRMFCSNVLGGKVLLESGSKYTGTSDTDFIVRIAKNENIFKL
jgi:hypothetical protein